MSTNIPNEAHAHAGSFVREKVGASDSLRKQIAGNWPCRETGKQQSARTIRGVCSMVGAYDEGEDGGAQAASQL
jgi:hypothetical protein